MNTSERFVSSIDVWDELTKSELILIKSDVIKVYPVELAAVWRMLVWGVSRERLSAIFNSPEGLLLNYVDFIVELERCGMIHEDNDSSKLESTFPPGVSGCHFEELSPIVVVNHNDEFFLARYDDSSLGLTVEFPSALFESVISNIRSSSDCDTNYFDENLFIAAIAVMENPCRVLSEKWDLSKELLQNYYCRYCLMYYQNTLEDLSGLIKEEKDSFVLSRSVRRAALRLLYYCYSLQNKLPPFCSHVLDRYPVNFRNNMAWACTMASSGIPQCLIKEVGANIATLYCARYLKLIALDAQLYRVNLLL